MRTRFAAAALLFLSSLCLAQSPDRSATGNPNDPCRKATTQLELNQCTDRKFHAADDEMQKSYKNFRAQLEKNASSPALENLNAAQQAWITYRDLECKAEAGQYAGGSIQPLIFSSCMESITQARLAQLNDTYGDK